ncbi:MAG: BatD family protein [Bacteroidetes bacterium]|nr:BatD family protein [Bacteroidota bacterium]
MRNVLLVLGWMCSAVAGAQTVFKTMVPKEPLVTGEAFQVQYILEDADRNALVVPPEFEHFEFVTGPNNYSGTIARANGNKLVMNTVYTLIPGKPGIYTIGGASALINGREIVSNAVQVRVISKEAARRRQIQESGYNPDYVLFPEEDAQEKIRKNLFVRVTVNKQTCFVGEPVLAEFKLYSRLQSKSDIVKNPGFYGFTMFDMVNLEDKVIVTEDVNGRQFNVHTIRKVQLYPLQAGSYTIDPMEVLNKVEFSKSAVRKRTEQQIAEGMLGGDTDDEVPAGTTIVESSISTEPVRITVKPLPEKTKPAGYSGAAGKFRINAAFEKNELSKNEEGVLEVIIRGKGNFIQLDAPEIPWPAGVEGFAPSVKDSLDKSKLPLEGSRTFRYTFICTSPGKYSIPAIRFSYFDTDSNTFHTVSSAPLTVTGTREEKKIKLREEQTVSIAAQSEKKARMAIVALVLIVLLVLLFYSFRKKEKPAVIEEVKVIPPLTAAKEFLANAGTLFETGGSSYYQALYTGTWQFLQERLRLSGSTVSKQTLLHTLEEKGIRPELTQNLLDILAQCETGIYTAAAPTLDKGQLYQETLAVLEAIENVV